jgi:hypothetical protein
MIQDDSPQFATHGNFLLRGVLRRLITLLEKQKQLLKRVDATRLTEGINLFNFLVDQDMLYW